MENDLDTFNSSLCLTNNLILFYVRALIFWSITTTTGIQARVAGSFSATGIIGTI